MATNQVLMTPGTPLIFASTAYAGGTNTVLIAGADPETDIITVVSLAIDGARQSAKADLGASHAALYSVDMTVEMALDVTAGGSIDLYWSQSHDATIAIGNMGGTSGADAAYTGYSTMTMDEGLRQMDFIGSLQLGVNNDLDGVQIGHVGIFSPVQRWGCLVVHNNSDQATHSDSVEFAVRLTPIIPDIQAAA